MFGKNLVPEIWAKMLSASQIAVFLNDWNLQIKSFEIALFFACWYQFKKIKFWVIIFRGRMAKLCVVNLVASL